MSSSDYSAIEELRAILGEACSLCHARGAQFLVVFAPDKFRVYKEFTEFDAQVKPRYWVINPLPNEIEKIVRQDLSGAGFLDLTNVFVGRARQGRLLYFDYDTHWSPEGHWIAASAIADFIRNWK